MGNKHRYEKCWDNILEMLSDSVILEEACEHAGVRVEDWDEFGDSVQQMIANKVAEEGEE